MTPPLVPLLLGTLVLLDSTFAGFRAAAGRNPRIFIWPYYRSASLRGALVGALLIAAFSAGAVGLVAAGGSTWDDLWSTGGTMVWVFGAYATLVLAGLALYLGPSLDLSVLASVLVLGPLTLLRVPFILAGGAVGIWGAQRPGTAVLAALACGCMAALERALGWGRAPWRDSLTLPRVPTP